MDIIIKWDLTYKCNLYCSHCLNGQYLNDVSEEFDLDGFKKIIDDLSASNVKKIHFLGGEPTVKKDFVEMMNYLDNKRIDFGFNTNGLKLNNAEILEMICTNKHLKNIVVSLEGPTAEINDEIRGKNVYDRILPNIVNLVKLKKEKALDHIKITINTVVSKKNLSHLINHIYFCINLGVDQVSFLQMLPTGNAADHQYSISFEEELELVKQIAEIYPDIRNKIEFTPKFTRPLASDYAKKILNKEFPQIAHGCGAGTSFGFINNKGELYPCDRFVTHITKRNLNTRSFMDIWAEDDFNILHNISESFDYGKNLEPCNKCQYFQTSCYPCPINVIEKDDTKINPCYQFNEKICG